MKVFQSQLERLLYLTLLVVFIAVAILAGLLYQVNRHHLERIEFLEEQIKKDQKLSSEIKTLAENIQDLSRGNRQLGKCMIRLFAEYTQNRRSIEIEDYDECGVSSSTQSTNTQPTTQQQQTAQSSKANPSSSKPTSKPPEEPPEPPEPTLPEQIIDTVCSVSPVLC